MKTFSECQEEAIDQLGYSKLFDLNDFTRNEYVAIAYVAAKIYAESAIDTAAEVAETDQDGDIYGGSVWVDKQTILSLKDQLK